MWHTFHPFWRLRKCTKSKNSLQQERQRSAANGRQPSSYHWYDYCQKNSLMMIKPWPTWTVAFFMINPSELSSRNTNKSSCPRKTTKLVLLQKILPTILCTGSKSLVQRISRYNFLNLTGSHFIQNIHPPSETLHLSNIPPEIEEDRIRELFVPYGNIKNFRFFQ